MCGRFGLFAELDALAEQFNFDPSIMRDIYSPRWNIPPTTPVLSVLHNTQVSESNENTARLLRWGMTGARGPRSKGSGHRLFNARAETVDRLPSFRNAFAGRRCLIPANGFYEWRKDASGGKTPVWFRREDDAPVAFAGIWAQERAAVGEVETCAIITCEANELVAPVHHRMPVTVPRTAYREWLNPDTKSERLPDLLLPTEWDDLQHYPVSKEVNNAGNDYPALIEPANPAMQMALDVNDAASGNV